MKNVMAVFSLFLFATNLAQASTGLKGYFMPGELRGVLELDESDLVNGEIRGLKTYVDYVKRSKSANCFGSGKMKIFQVQSGNRGFKYTSKKKLLPGSSVEIKLPAHKYEPVVFSFNDACMPVVTIRLERDGDVFTHTVDLSEVKPNRLFGVDFYMLLERRD